MPFLFAFIGPLQAQQSKEDSIILLLNKSRIKTGIDSATFLMALNLINQTTLTDSLVNEIESEGAKFNKRADEDLSYFIKFAICDRMCTINFSKAITYGTLNFEKLKTSKTPLALFFRDNFLIDLRLAYRNSHRLTEGFKYFSEQLNEFQKQKDSAGMGVCHYVLGGFFRITGLYDQSIYQSKKAISYMDSASNGPLFF